MGTEELLRRLGGVDGFFRRLAFLEIEAEDLNPPPAAEVPAVSPLGFTVPQTEDEREQVNSGEAHRWGAIARRFKGLFGEAREYEGF